MGDVVVALHFTELKIIRKLPGGSSVGFGAPEFAVSDHLWLRPSLGRHTAPHFTCGLVLGSHHGLCGSCRRYQRTDKANPRTACSEKQNLKSIGFAS